MRAAKRSVALALILAAVAAPALASDRTRVAIPAGRLREALTALAVQEDATIGLADADLAASPTPALRGRMTIDEALGKLLRHLPARAIRIDRQTFRIDREAVPPRQRPAIMRLRAVPMPTAPAPTDIIVTASKRGTALGTYPGTASMLDAQALRTTGGLRGSAAIVALLPAISSTNLGPGRNKLFIRGVADSSFNGPTQATVGQYLGDVRLNYNAPDPDLELYDVRSVEVLEGPQGTLYGAGSLGGIIRILPNPVRLDASEGSAAVGLSTTQHGATSYDLAAALNVAVTPQLGVRGVAYRSVEGGWIDDVGRGLDDINQTRTKGGRLTALFKPGDDWSVQLGGVLQDINSDDGQYAERGLARLSRRSAVAQPFDNDYLLGDLLVTGGWHDLKLVIAGGLVRHTVISDYDFTPPDGLPRIFRQKNGITLFSGETRLSRSRPDGSGWIVGLSGIVDDERLTRSLGSVVDPVRIAGVRNGTDEGAIFGEMTVALGSRLLMTAGGRTTYSHQRGHGLDDRSAEKDEPGRGEYQVLPAIAVAWKLGSHLLLFGRYQEGYRPGGLSVAANGDDRSVERFRGDTIGTFEAGVRLAASDSSRIDGQLGMSYAHWEHIQADLIDATGLPYSANIGTGRLFGFEARARWRPLTGLAAEAAIFVNKSDLVHPAAGFAASDGLTLPNIAELGGRAGISYAHELGSSLDIRIAADARYVGRSRLGVGPVLDLSQGRYVDSDANVRLSRGGLGLTIGLTNLLDTVGNRFSFGDPYDVSQGRQITPLRPRTVRIGLDAAF